MTPSFPTRRSSDLRNHDKLLRCLHRRLRSDLAFAAGQRGPADFDTLAMPLLDQLKAVRVDGEGVGLVADLHFASQRFVELGHRGVSSCAFRRVGRSAEHTSELPSLMRSSYAVFWLKTKNSN